MDDNKQKEESNVESQPLVKKGFESLSTLISLTLSSIFLFLVSLFLLKPGIFSLRLLFSKSEDVIPQFQNTLFLGISVVLILLFVFSFMVTLYYFIRQNTLNDGYFKSSLKILVKLIFGMNLIIFISLTSYVIIVLPTFQTLKPVKFKTEFVSDSKMLENSNKLAKLCGDFSKKVKKLEEDNSIKNDDMLFLMNYKSDVADLYIKSLDKDAEEIMEFLRANLIALNNRPKPDDFNELGKMIQEEEKNTLSKYGILSPVKLKFLKIHRSVYKKSIDRKEVLREYLNMWKTLDAAYKTKNNEMVNWLINTAIVEECMVAYNVLSDSLTMEEASTIKELLPGIIKSQEQMAKEIWVRVYTDANAMWGATHKIFSFPFFNYNYTMNLTNDLYTYHINNLFSSKEVEEKNKSSEEFHNYQKAVNYLKDRNLMRLIENPVGNTLFKININAYGGVQANYKRKIRNLYFLNYLLDKNKTTETPVDIFSEIKVNYNEKNGLCVLTAFDSQKDLDKDSPSIKLTIHK